MFDDPILTDEQGRRLRRRIGDCFTNEVLEAEARYADRILRSQSNRLGVLIGRCAELESQIDQLRAALNAAERPLVPLVNAVLLWFDWLDGGNRDRLTGKAWEAIRAMRQAVEPYERERWARENALPAVYQPDTTQGSD